MPDIHVSLKIKANRCELELCRAHTDERKQIKWDMLRIGESLTLYRRTYHITACDSSTRSFYEQTDRAQPPDSAVPQDPYEAKKKVRGPLVVEVAFDALDLCVALQLPILYTGMPNIKTCLRVWSRHGLHRAEQSR